MSGDENMNELHRGNGNNHGSRSELSSPMLTIAEVATLLHAHPNTVRLWSNCGLLKVYRVGPRRDRRFNREDVDTFLKGSPSAES